MDNQNQNQERALDWTDRISQEGKNFITLPEGDYDFEVLSFERGRHNGSEKLPPCNKAILTIRIESNQGCVDITHNLFLHSKCEGILSSFFIAIGQKKHGEDLRMDWSKVTGARGRAHVIIHTWISNNTGKECESNQIRYFLEPSEKAEAAPRATWKEGQF